MRVCCRSEPVVCRWLSVMNVCVGLLFGLSDSDKLCIEQQCVSLCRFCLSVYVTVWMPCIRPSTAFYRTAELFYKFQFEAGLRTRLHFSRI